MREIKSTGKSRTLKEISEIGRKNDEGSKIRLDIKEIDAKLDTAELVCTKTDGTKYDFNRFAFPLKFIEKIYNYEITLDEAKDDQDKLEKLIIRLENYKARINKKEKRKIKSYNLQENCFVREKILLVFLKKEFFRLKVMCLKQKKNQKKNHKKNK